MSAPASTQRLHHRLPGRALAVGDENFAQFRIAGHLAQHPVVASCSACHWREARSARPVRSCRDARARAPRRGRRGNRHAHGPARSALRRGARAQAEAERARDNRARCCDAARYPRSARPRHRLRRHSRSVDRQAFAQASRGGYCTRPQRQRCSSNRPSAARRGEVQRDAAARRRRQRRLPQRAGPDCVSWAVRQASSCVSSRRRQYRGAGAEAAIVIDHAEPADQRDAARLSTCAPRACRVTCRTASTSPR